MDSITIRGAKTHNLKNINLQLPRDRLIVITGLSGSGKSSLAFDTIFAEGQRRYVESLSAYARQFLSIMEKPDIEHIEGLSPAISIEQKSTSHNPRSTVGTITEVYDYLRLLYARTGTPQCPQHHISLEAQTISQMVDAIISLPEGSRAMLLAPIVRERKGEHLDIIDQLRTQGFVRARIDRKIYELDQIPKLSLHRKHTIEAIVDRFKIRPDISNRLAESLETALRLSNGLASLAPIDNENGELEEMTFSSRFACSQCGYSLAELEPRLFSFNNPVGACPSCDGLGIEQLFDPEKIVAYPHLSLAGGAINGWSRRNLYYFQMLKSLAEHYHFDIEMPYEKLDKKIQEVILFGSGTEKITFDYANERLGRQQRTHRFEGIVHNLRRRYHETASNALREELSRYMTTSYCSECHGTRLNEGARNVYIDNRNLPDVTALPVGESLTIYQKLKLPGHQGKIAEKIIKEIISRLQFLVNVGLDYLTLDRSAETLSGGEAQRIRLASQIGSGLTGVMYILDEPSIGLHSRDNDRLLNTLVHLRDLGNTVIVVEHDKDAITTADHVVDIGPGAGIHGGNIVAQGNPEEIIANPDSITGRYLSGKKSIVIPNNRHRPAEDQWLTIKGANGNNLKSVTARIPIGLMTCVTGVSGSGKSTLINETIYKIAHSELNHAHETPSPYQSIEGLEFLDKVVDINQSPIGRTPRSNPATYTGLFTTIRELFAGTPESRSRGYKPGRFSFNVKGGRCEACQGDGVIKVEMHFLPDIYVNCDVCQSKRYNRETMEILYKGKDINEVLNLTVEDALQFFNAIPAINRKLQTLIDVGLSYIKLGQNATTLSGGEAQRIKLAKELSKRDTGKTLYILDEPTTGLHFHDIEQLLSVLHRLRDHGNTIIIIEHNMDVIKTADWIIDLGPEGGSGGGEIIAAGTPENITKISKSYTGLFLKPYLKKNKKRSSNKRKSNQQN